MVKTRPLKLRAIDAEDLKVVSAALQDAIVPIGDMAFLSEDNSFVMIANRFKWECCDDLPPVRKATDLSGEAGAFADDDLFERTNCGVCFSGVVSVKCRGIDLHNRHQFLSLLTVTEDAGILYLHFAGGACIRLETHDWNCRLEDLGDPWPTGVCPCHGVTEDVPQPRESVPHKV